jgi:ElaB/YqjD/DUF883 family membrane-anchored ribosome-binding protein
MTKTKAHHAKPKDDPRDRFSSDLETLKSSFTQLREDVTQLIGNTVGTGKSGAGLVKQRASTAVTDFKDRMGDLKDCGVESVEKFGQTIGKRPFLSTAIAVAIGFVLARLIRSKR